MELSYSEEKTELPIDLFDERAQQNTLNTNFEEERNHIPIDLPVEPSQKNEFPVGLFEEGAQQNNPNTKLEKKEKHIPVELPVVQSQKKEFPVNLLDETAQQNTPITNFGEEKCIPVELSMVPAQPSTASTASTSESFEKKTSSRRKKMVNSEVLQFMKQLFIKINEVDVTWPTKKENVLWLNVCCFVLLSIHRTNLLLFYLNLIVIYRFQCNLCLISRWSRGSGRILPLKI